MSHHHRNDTNVANWGRQSFAQHRIHPAPEYCRDDVPTLLTGVVKREALEASTVEGRGRWARGGLTPTPELPAIQMKQRVTAQHPPSWDHFSDTVSTSVQ